MVILFDLQWGQVDGDDCLGSSVCGVPVVPTDLSMDIISDLNVTDWSLWWALEGSFFIVWLSFLILASLVTLLIKVKGNRKKTKRSRKPTKSLMKKLARNKRWLIPLSFWMLFGYATYSWIVDIFFLRQIVYCFDLVIWWFSSTLG